MRSLLILTDFSETAFRAAEFACALADTFRVRRIVLYHAYQTAVATTDLPVSTVGTNRKIHLEAMEALSLLSDRLKSILPHPVTIDLLAEDTFLPGDINERCREQGIDLIVMGVSGKSGFDRLLLGNTAARMLTTSRFPLLVIPGHAPVRRSVSKLVFTTDLKDEPAISGDRLYPLLDAFKAEISVVNVGDKEIEEKDQAEIKKALGGLHQLLDKYHPSYHYLGGNNVVKGILDFAGTMGASLIIAIPKEHGLLSSLFHRSVSEKLAYNSPIPLLFFPGE
jgi:nucleotide-binding universal stress UspA family protein